MAIVDTLGHEIKVQRRPPSERAGAVPLAMRTSPDVTTLRTPEAIRNANSAARRGDMRPLMQIAQELENDPFIMGLLRQRRLAAVALKYVIDSGDENDATANKIAEDVREQFARLNVRRIVAHLQDAVFKPLAASEMIWAVDGGKNVITDIIDRLGTEFTYDYLTTGEQLRIVTDIGQPTGTPIDPLKFVVRRSEEKGTTLPAEAGAVQGLAGRWLVMLNMIIAWAIFAERDGMPLRVGTYDDQIDDDSKIAILKRAVQQMGIDAGAVIPKSMQIEIKEGMKNSGRDVFGMFITVLERHITLAILGQVLSSQAGPTGLGSGLSDVQNEVRHELVEADAAANGETLSWAVKLYVIFNYGEQKAYPKLRFLSDPEEDLTKRLAVDEGLQRMGFPFTVEYMSRVYDRPIPEASDTLLEKVVAPNPFATPDPNADPAAARSRLLEAFTRRMRQGA